MQVIGRVAALFLLVLPLAGCFEATRGTIAGGECKVMERPPYVVQGKAAYDQNWIDNEIEGGVAACGWNRPAARPPELDAVPAKKVARAPVKKKSILARAKARIWPKAAAPVLPTPAPPVVVVEPTPVPTPTPRPREPIDELLQVK